jgi:hypothetical protein
MGAVTRRQKDTVAYLLQKGANPNVVGRSYNGSSTRWHLALFGAVNSGDLEIARTLLRAGADPNLVGAYAVSFAKEQGDIEMYNLLLQHGGRMPAPAPSNQPRVTAAPAGEAEFKALGFAELLPGAAGASKTATVKQRQRLAIVADDLNLAAADLLLARLSKHPRFELVERQELDRVLAERKLSKQFAADAANFRQVATFLRADVLALIRTRKVAGIGVVETRFVRVDAGLVLDTFYRPAPLTLANWMEEMAQRAGDVAERVTRPNAIAVSMLDVHATVRAATARPLERTLTLLLRERLVRDPQFAVLERSELEKVAFEQNGSFWTGSYLLRELQTHPAAQTSGTGETDRVERGRTSQRSCASDRRADEANARSTRARGRSARAEPCGGGEQLHRRSAVGAHR